MMKAKIEYSQEAPRHTGLFFFESELGKVASHGCVRLTPKNAALLYNLVVRYLRHNKFPDVIIITMNEKFLPVSHRRVHYGEWI